MQDVVAEITRPAGEGNGGYARRARSGVYRTVRMPVFDRFVASRREAMPAAYFLPPRLSEIAALLGRQGIEVGRLRRTWSGPAERFTIDTFAAGPLFEGHRTVTADGHWGAPAALTAEPGWYVVSTAQPLGVLAAYLLEPASEDGIVTWNLLDRELEPRSAYPILRVRAPVRAAVEELPSP